MGKTTRQAPGRRWGIAQELLDVPVINLKDVEEIVAGDCVISVYNTGCNLDHVVLCESEQQARQYLAADQLLARVWLMEADEVHESVLIFEEQITSFSGLVQEWPKPRRLVKRPVTTMMWFQIFLAKI